jgi:hypothetical protein
MAKQNKTSNLVNKSLGGTVENEKSFSINYSICSGCL